MTTRTPNTQRAAGWSSPASIGAVLDRTRGIGQGFDCLRLLLSFAIVCWHSVSISAGFAAETRLWLTPAGALASALLPAFFGLSGFLVMGSAARVRSLTTFLSFRALRILPALSTEICLAAVLIGGLATTLPAGQYYTSAGFFRYFLNVSGNVVFMLPGVFKHNPIDGVNGSLWTIPPEITCYVFMALMLLSGACLRRGVYLAVAVLLVAIDLQSQPHLTTNVAYGPIKAHDLFLSFVIGAVLYFWRHAIPASRTLFVLCAGIGLVLIRVPAFISLALCALCYCTVYLGTRRLTVPGWFSRGDYSYGIYLYGYPVQQVIVQLFPTHRVWWFNLLASVPPILLCAVFSWHVIEKPALALKQHAKALHRHEAAALARFPVRLAIAGALLCYGVLLLHWSGFDKAAHLGLKAYWPLVAASVAGLALLVAWPRSPSPSTPNTKVAAT